MAQGVTVHAANYAEAYEKAGKMLFIDGNKPSDELRLAPAQKSSVQLCECGMFCWKARSGAPPEPNVQCRRDAEKSDVLRASPFIGNCQKDDI